MTHNNIHTPVSAIMHRHVITCDASSTVRQCAQKIASEHVGCLIVVKAERPVGIITERSFVELVKGGRYNPDTMKASDIMRSPLFTITPTTDFLTAMQIFDNRNVKRLPVVLHDKIVGLLSLQNMIEFSNLVLVNQQKKLKMQANTDALTGLLNKAAVTHAIRKEHERIKRFGGRSSILFMDIDHFKLVNDRYTHLAGDVVLKEMGILLKKACREIDTVGRFGGEEFIVIAPNRKKYHAIKFGERIRQAIEEHIFKFKGIEIRLTISIGIASLFEGRDFAVALERADKALYHAKKTGRNKIGLWRNGKLSVALEHDVT